MNDSETVGERIERLRHEAYHSTVAQIARTNELLRCGQFATEEDFDKELKSLLLKWETGGSLDF